MCVSATRRYGLNMHKESGENTTKLAADLLNDPYVVGGASISPETYNELLRKAKSLAGSVLAQSEPE